MKAKLLKVIVQSHRVFRSSNYEGEADYSDVMRHIVTDFSPMEEVTGAEFSELQRFVGESNNKYNPNYNPTYPQEYFMLITDDQPMSCKKAIQEMRDEQEKKIQRWKKEDEERKKAAAEKKIADAANRKARLEKQLIKLSKELNEHKS